MANALPILLLGGAAAIMLTSKKKKKGASGLSSDIAPSLEGLKLEPTTPPPLPKAVEKSGSGYPELSRKKMQRVQTILVANGYSVGSYGLDGKYGPATKRAVWEFQEDWNDSLGKGYSFILEVDGKPGEKTRKALSEVEWSRIENLPDDCDPLDPHTWGTGHVCVFKDGKWTRVWAESNKSS